MKYTLTIEGENPQELSRIAEAIYRANEKPITSLREEPLLSQTATGLPKSWGVCNDNSKQFNNTVLAFLKEKYDARFDGRLYGFYYGIDINNSHNVGSEKNFNTILTIEQFCELAGIADPGPDEVPLPPQTAEVQPEQKATRLSDGWCVWNDGSKRFFNTVIKYINSQVDFPITQEKIRNNVYYAEDPEITQNKNDSRFFSTIHKPKQCQLLTIEQFCELAGIVDPGPDEVAATATSPTQPQPEKLSYGGDIAHLPAEIVEKMLERQEEQTGKRDVTVFEQNRFATKDEGGIDWISTKEGSFLWTILFNRNDYTEFYKLYPKEA